MRRKIILFALMTVIALLLTACGKQTQNSPVLVNQQSGVADVLQQGIAAAENDAAADETISSGSVAAVDAAESSAVADETTSSENAAESAAAVNTPVTEMPVLPTEIPAQPTETSLPEEVPAGGEENSDGVDIDLTKLSSTMVYAEVYSMLSTPRNYIGKTVRMRGDYSFFYDKVTDLMYHACLIKDATACCAQGLEFVLNDDYKYPEDYPNPGDEVTIVGQFNFYNEGDYIYYNLIDAVWER